MLYVVLTIIFAIRSIQGSLSDHSDTSIKCYDHTEPLPITSITDHQITLEGEDVLYTCSFQSNYDGYIKAMYDIFWHIKLKNGDTIIDHDTINSSVQYKVDEPSSQCPSYNYSCCNFVSILHINVTGTLDGAVITCQASSDQLNSEKSSSLSVIPNPFITTPPKNVSVEKDFLAEFKCFASASSQYYDLTKFRWLKDGTEVNQIDDKHDVISHPVGGGENNEWESILDISDVANEDEGSYTCIVYYDSSVLEQHHINSDKSVDPCDKASAYLTVTGDSSDSSDSSIFPSAIIAFVILFALVCGGMIAIICCVKLGCCRLDGLPLHRQDHHPDYYGTTTPYGHNYRTGNFGHARPNEPNNPNYIIGANATSRTPQPGSTIRHPGAPKDLSIGERAKMRPPVQITDLRSAHNVLRQRAISSWNELGLQLGLASDKLKEISADCRDNDYGRHIERVIELWKQQSHKRTWKDLLMAIEVTTVNPQLCMDLSMKHQAELDDNILDKDLANEVLPPMAKYWFELGLALGIDETQLDKVPVSDSQCFRRMLQAWWQQNLAVDRTWNNIVFCLDAVNLSAFAKEVYDLWIGAE